MPSKRSFMDYQSRAYSFQIGDTVSPLIGRGAPFKGTVIAVYPAIGQIDVQLPYGTQRFSVEDVIPDGDSSDEALYDIFQDAVPGGVGTVRVPGGPPPEIIYEKSMGSSKTARIVDRFIKRSMYWNGIDRQYKATRNELASGSFGCPKCKNHMSSAVYKRREGLSSKLLCCPSCSFVIKFDDIQGN